MLPADPKPPRVWPGLLLVAGYWSLIVYLTNSDLVISTSFMITAGRVSADDGAFLIGGSASRVPWSERLTGRRAAIAGGVFAVLFRCKR